MQSYTILLEYDDGFNKRSPSYLANSSVNNGYSYINTIILYTFMQCIGSNSLWSSLNLGLSFIYGYSIPVFAKFMPILYPLIGFLALLFYLKFTPLVALYM